MKQIDESVDYWVNYLHSLVDWRSLVGPVVPKDTKWGLIYELPDMARSEDEDFAIADMRQVKAAEPHYHPDGVYEVYIVLQGSGLVVVGGDERSISRGSVVITPPKTTHFMIPKSDLVLAVITVPPFSPGDYIAITRSNKEFKFSKDQFERLAS